MSAGTVLSAALTAAVICCAAVALSGYVRMARTKGGWRDAGCWYGPLIFSSAALALLTAAGALAPLAGAVTAMIPLLAIAVRPALFWRSAAKTRLGKGGASRLTLSLLWDRVRDALWNAREDLRDLAGLLRRDGAAEEGARPVPVRATPGVPPWRRSVPGVPSILNDPALGAVPAPSEVSAALAASGVIVPPEWVAVASAAADFEPESDEELCEHMDGEVAGVLTWAEGVMARAETLGDVVGLDPAYIAAQYEFADDVAELAAHGAQVMRRYHDYHDDLREAADDKPLPPRHWFTDGGAPQGGHAA